MSKTSCSSCGSSDGVEVYEDGQTHCFVCEAHTFAEGSTVKKEDFVDESWERVEVTPLEKIREISAKAFSKFSYGRSPNGAHVINHYNLEGKVVAQKFRYEDKTFSWKGNVKEAVPFGMNEWRSGGKRITITEGELDALSISTALDNRYPVISINNGAQGAAKDLKKHLEFLNSYDEVCIWFDNDKPGRDAVKEVSALFPQGNLSIIQTTYKDANEVLKKQGIKGVIAAYYETKIYTPAGIVNANEGGFDALVEDASSDEVYDTPYPNFEVSKGAITTIVSGSGMGKSTLTREVGYHLLMYHGLTIGHVALEENNAVSKRAYIGIDLNEQLIKKTHWKEYKDSKENLPKLKESYDKVIGTDRLFLYNHFGSIDSDSLLNKLRYLVVGAGCDFIILDHISIVVSGLDDMGDNERRVIDVLMTKLRSLVEETGCGMILVSHLKRPPGEKGHEDGVQPRLSHLRGSGSIAQLSDQVIGIEGNQQSETESNKRGIRRLKDREGGETGLIGGAIYIKEEGRLLADDIPEQGGFTDEQQDF